MIHIVKIIKIIDILNIIAYDILNIGEWINLWDAIVRLLSSN